MSGTFDDEGTGSDPTGKRPVPTIEGTATEVSAGTGAEGQEAADAPRKAPEAISASGDERYTEAREADGSDVPGEEYREEGLEDPRSEDANADATVRAEETQPDKETRSDEETNPNTKSYVSHVVAWLAALFTHALAGLAGGLAVLAALVWGYLPNSGLQVESGRDKLETRIAALEASPDTTENSAALDGLKSRLATLELGTKDSKLTAVDPSQVRALSDQVAQMETSLKSMADAAKDGGSVAEAAAISQQVAEAEQRLDSQLQNKVQSEVKAALARGGIESPSGASIEALKAEVSELNAKLKALTEATMDVDEGPSWKAAVLALQRRLNEIEATLPSVLDAVDAENTQTRKANLVIAYSALRDTVNSGRPYMTELAMMTALSGGSDEFNALSEHEKTGIPTVAMLTSSFATLREKALAEVLDTEPDLVSRLLGSAQSLVKVRRIGDETDGSGPRAILANAQAELVSGKLRDAALEVEKLEGPFAKVFGPWIDDVLARLDADTTLQRLQDALLVSLAASHDAPSKPDPAAQDEETE